MLTLYTTPLSANGRKVMALGHQLGLAPEVRLVNVYRGEGRAAEYLAINPAGKIPTLVDDGFTLHESNAILIYLAEAHGECRLWAREPRARAAIARWLFWESAHWQPALTAVLAPVVRHHLLPDVFPDPPADPDWSHEDLAPLLIALEAELTRRPFLAGDALTIADLSVAGMTTYFRAAKFPFASLPAFARWHERIEATGGWRATAVEPWKVGA